MSPTMNMERPDACREFRERTSAVHDGEHAGEEARGSWSRHALSCADCQEFERRLPEVASDLAVLRGTPVPDLWPTIAARTLHRPRRSWIPFAAAAAGALATWAVLAGLASERSRPPSGAPSLARALASIAAAGAQPEALTRIDRAPELQLLAHLGRVGATQEENR